MIFIFYSFINPSGLFTIQTDFFIKELFPGGLVLT